MDQKYKLQTVCNPKHTLFLTDRESVFVCRGCKEKGIGSRCTCTACGIDLHTFCAVPWPTFHHPFHKHGFQFLEKPYPNKQWICDACGNDILGFVYHCESCGFDLHPTCAHLPQALCSVEGDTNHTLRLCAKLSSSCNMCNKKGKGATWAYKCGCRKYNLHVSCAKQIVSADVSDDCRFVACASTAITRMHSHGRWGRRVKKMCSVALAALRVILAAVLGDPTTLILQVTSALISL